MMRKTVMLPSLIKASLITGNAIMDDGKVGWNDIVQQLLQISTRVIAMRGAGSWNGMDRKEIDTMLEEVLIPRLEQLTDLGYVTVLFDGDYDVPSQPDLGYVMGRLLDHFGNISRNVIFLVAQQESWHPDDRAGLNLQNSVFWQFPTYLFPDDTYPGRHSDFTQSVELVAEQKYEQWYIGAAGLISLSQLFDYHEKVPMGEVRQVRIFRVRNNPELDQVFAQKLSLEKDSVQQAKLANRIEQREQIFGLLWNNDGTHAIKTDEFPRLEFEFVTIP